MRFAKKFCLLALLALSVSAWANEKAAFDTLKQVSPHLPWDAQSALAIDIDCDQHGDYAFLSQGDDKATIGIVLGREKNPKVYTQTIAMGNGANELCPGKASIQVESLDYNPKYVTWKTVKGFTRSTCKAFRLASEKCESFHFFWDADKNAPSWWRRAK